MTSTAARKKYIALCRKAQKNLQTDYTENGKQYVSDGFSCAIYNDIIEPSTEIYTTNPRPRIGNCQKAFDDIASQIHEQHNIQIDYKQIALAATQARNVGRKKHEIYVKIAGMTYQEKYITTALQSIEQPTIYTTKYNALVAMGNNGVAVILPYGQRQKNGILVDALPAPIATFWERGNK